MMTLPRRDLELGLLSGSDDSLVLTHDQRTRHMLAIGKSGGGKSKFLEHMIRQDILLDPNEPGLLLIDPHGELYNDLVNWCAYVGVNRRIHLFNPSDTSFVPGYNPFRTGTAAPEVLAKAMAEGCALVFQEESTSTPMIRETLTAVFYSLITNECALTEAAYLMSTDDPHGIRSYLTSSFPNNEAMQDKWNHFNSLASNPRTNNEFRNQMASSSRRLFELNTSERLRSIFGQTDGGLNISEAMKNGDIVLVNLSTKANHYHDSDARLLGVLMLRDIMLSAKARDIEFGKAHPFFVYVDECYEYLTSDVEKMLDQTRKFGVHLTLSCQRIGQLRAAGDEIYNGVMGGTEAKVVFGGLAASDAIDMAEDIYMCELDLERGVELTKKQTVVGQKVVKLENSTVTKTSTNNWGDVSGSNSAEHSPGDGSPSGSTDGSSDASSSGGSSSRADSRGLSEALASVYEEKYSAVWSKDTLIFEKAAFLKGQPKRHAVAFIHSVGAYQIKIPFVGSAYNAIDSDLSDSYVVKAIENTGCAIPWVDARVKIDSRLDNLKGLSRVAVYGGGDDYDDERI